MALALLEVAGKTGVVNLDQGAGTNTVRALLVEAVNIVRYELPTNHGVAKIRETRVPGVD